MKSYRAGFSEKNPVFRKIPDKWSNSRFLSIFSTLKFFKFFYIVNLDNLNCFLSFAKNCRSKQVRKKFISRFDERQYAKNDIFSTLKFFKIFYIVNLDNLNCFLSFAKNCRSKKIYFAF